MGVTPFSLHSSPETATASVASASLRAAASRGPMRPAALTPTRTRVLGWAISISVQVVDVAVLCVLAAISNFGAPWLPLSVAGGLLLVGLALTGAYALPPHESIVRHLTRIVTAALLPAAAISSYAVFGDEPLAGNTLALWIIQILAVLMLAHAGAWALVRHWRRQGLLTPTLVIVGATPGAERLIGEAIRTGDVAILGIFDDRKDRVGPHLRGVPVLGDTSALLTHRIMPCVDRVVITVAPTARNRVATLVEQLSVLPNPISLLLDDGAKGDNKALSRIAGLSLANVSGQPNNNGRAIIKRALDLTVTSLGLLMAAPVMLAIALAVKLDSPGPIFFRQRRHGFNNEAINVWKFRSMRHEAADATASRQISAADERVTRVGRFIRRTSLDELPQLFNVLTGEMSLVGPRPHAIGMKTGDTPSAQLVSHYAHRHRMKPGLTGWAAIKGSRGAVDTPESVRRRVALDVEYIERQSLWLDLYILVMTVPCLLGDDEAVR
ncbi:MAG: hypothetical protein BGN86_00790 [Caulobacterales bacterium 68-7]|nr:MAG: hypothetical protein BGN86_00790 [Caulobacterales bacterium 68-7]